MAGIDNLLAAGMLIASDHDAHMSTRNTVCCMGQGQATGAAAALASSLGRSEVEFRRLGKTGKLGTRLIILEKADHRPPAPPAGAARRVKKKARKPLKVRHVKRRRQT